MQLQHTGYETRNLSIANRSRVTAAHTQINNSTWVTEMIFKGHRKCHDSI